MDVLVRGGARRTIRLASTVSRLHYGIGIVGNGATPQIADRLGGRSCGSSIAFGMLVRLAREPRLGRSGLRCKSCHSDIHVLEISDERCRPCPAFEQV